MTRQLVVRGGVHGQEWNRWVRLRGTKTIIIIIIITVDLECMSMNAIYGHKEQNMAVGSGELVTIKQ